MADDDGAFPFAFGGDDNDDTVAANEVASSSTPANVAATAASTTSGPLLHLLASSMARESEVTAEIIRCPYGFCRLQCHSHDDLNRHQAQLGHYVCMECAKPRTSRLPGVATSPPPVTADKLVATRAFQSQRLLSLHLASMHGIGTAVSTSQRGGNGWSLNDLCDDLLLRMLSYLDLVTLLTTQHNDDFSMY
jgi:hypothetical protein